MKKTLDERFWEKVDKQGPLHPTLGQCWNWKAFKDWDGYGKLQIRNTSKGAHRVSWELNNGTITDQKKQVMHLCDNTSCVNPEHLTLGTAAENNRDRKLKGRNRDQRGEKNEMSRLSQKDVEIIRYLNTEYAVTHESLAGVFRVARATISLIIENKRWVGENEKK